MFNFKFIGFSIEIKTFWKMGNTLCCCFCNFCCNNKNNENENYYSLNDDDKTDYILR
jgi:hypothetical protein